MSAEAETIDVEEPPPKPGRRQYGRADDGTPIVSVTTVRGATLGWSSEARMRWAARIAAEATVDAIAMGAPLGDAQRAGERAHTAARNAAADAGTIAHAMIEAYLLGEDPDDRVPVFAPSSQVAAARTACASFVAWWPTSAYDLVSAETAYVDRAVGYGGTIDLLLRRKSDRVLLVGDIKTGRRTYYDETCIQLGAYGVLARLHGHDVREGLIIHAPISGDPLATYPIPTIVMEHAARAFAALLLVHKTRQMIQPMAAEEE